MHHFHVFRLRQTYDDLITAESIHDFLKTR